MASEQIEPPEAPSGRMIIKYLQEAKDGATLSDILQHLRLQYGYDSRDLNKIVTSILENGTCLGFLEQKGSRYKNWMASQNSCSRPRRRRRRSQCCRPRRRRRSRCCRPRRRRRRQRRCCRVRRRRYR